MSENFFSNLGKKLNKDYEDAHKKKSYSSTNYEEKLWTGFSKTNKQKILKFVTPLVVTTEENYEEKDMDGNPIFDDFSAKIVQMSTIYGDDKSKKYFFVPRKADDPSHFFWRLQDVVMKKDWIKNEEGKDTPVLVHKDAHPVIIDRIETNGANTGISEQMYPQGWYPKETLFANVIDRTSMDILKEKKHTMLLSKNSWTYTQDDGTEQIRYTQGVEGAGSLSKGLNTLVEESAMPLTSFDVFVERTGDKNIPWNIKNATAFVRGDVPGIPNNLKEFVSMDEDLTEEEKSWKRYNIRNLTKPSSYFKWYNHIKVFLKAVDSTFGTNFYEEVKEKADAEKAQWEKEAKEKEAQKTQENSSSMGFENVSKENASPAPTVETTSSETVESSGGRRKKSRSTETSTGPLPITWETLASFGFKGEAHFESVKPFIQSISSDGKILWKEGTSLEGCIDEADGREFEGPCDFKSPANETITGCLMCGEKF